MTEENYEYRTNQIMLRNQFPGDGAFQIPIIPKVEFLDEEFRDLLLIGFDRTKADDERNTERMVHFFLYDYKFERVWKEPDRDIERLKPYRAVLSPDFSMYLEMNPAMQLYNTFRNRWCGASFANQGLRVIPTVSWGNENTFDFCFLGIPKGSTVAVSTYMVSEHDNRKDQKEFFMKGYREMLKRIEPERIICYNTPFPEMEGNIVFVDYELSSWKYQKETDEPSPFLKYICGALPLPKNSGIIIKRGYVEMGMGSSRGGEWRPSPNKPGDQRLIGEPGQVKQNGTTQTHIGKDGYADYERHNTDHGTPNQHTNPHDHSIDWSNGFPDFGNQINYPDGAPDFGDVYGGGKAFMNIKYIPANTPEQNRFTSISDFKWSMKCGGEVQFIWNGVTYGCFGKIKPKDGTHTKMLICQSGSAEENIRTEKWCDNADELLEYMVGGDRLRDVITQVTVIERTI